MMSWGSMSTISLCKMILVVAVFSGLKVLRSQSSTEIIFQEFKLRISMLCFPLNLLPVDFN